MIHLLELYCLRTSNDLSLGVWWVSNMLTHTSHFPSWIVVNSSSFMCFDEFCECTGDLSTGTKIEMKKDTKRSILEQRKTKEKKYRAIADRSRYISRLIGRSFKEKEQKDRTTTDRSRHTSRSIGTISEDRPQHSRSIATQQPIDQPTPTKPNIVSADRSRNWADRSAKPSDAKRHRFPDF